MTYAEYFKGCRMDQIPGSFIMKRFGNQEGSFLLYTDGSKGWLDPETKTVFHYISLR